MRHKRRRFQHRHTRGSPHARKQRRIDGRERERLVEDGLALLREQGYIRAYYRCLPFGKDDQSGVDAGIITYDGHEIRFQVKGSPKGVRKHLRKHPDIPWVNVGRCASPTDTAALIQQTFQLFYRNAQP